MATIEMWTFSTQTAPNIDLSGFKVEATDGDIGKVDEATNEVGGSFIIVDTGPWIFGKKVMLPAGLIRDIDPDTETIFVTPHEGRDQERAGVRRGPLQRRGLPRRARRLLRRSRPLGADRDCALRSPAPAGLRRSETDELCARLRSNTENPDREEPR